MLIAEYSYEKDIQIKQQEAKQEGRQEGRQEGIYEGWDKAIILSGKIIGELKQDPFLTSEQIAEKLGIEPETVEDIRKKLDLFDK